MSLREAALRATPDAEAELAQGAKERTPAAWAELYDTHYERLFRYCYARTSDPQAAADLASQVFLEALEGIHRYTYRGKPMLAWLYRIAHNLVSDYRRKRQRETKALEAASSVVEVREASPAQAVENKHDLDVAIRELTDDQQQVVALRYYAGLATPEIASAMGRSERAVYSLEVRALVALRDILNGDSTKLRNGRR